VKITPVPVTGRRLPRQDPASRLSGRLGALVLICAGMVAYANSLSGPFIVDDAVTIIDNPHIRQLWPLSRALVTEQESTVAGRPLVNLSFAINYAMGGLHVGGYHLVNIVLHVLCALLLFGIVRRTLLLPPLHLAERSTPIAVATAMLWLVHPLNTEAVDYVTQRTELMMGACYLLALYASIRAREASRTGSVSEKGEDAPSRPVRAAKGGRNSPVVRRTERPRARLPSLSRAAGWWLVLAVVACGLGMACKESMVTAPVMIWLYDRTFHDETRQTRWPFYAGLAATWLVLAGLNWSGPRIHSAGWSAGVSVWTYLLNQAVMIVRYLRLTLWPADLVLGYGYPRPLTLGDVWPDAVLVVALLGLTIASLRTAPRLGFLGAWFFVTLAPTSSVVPIATEVGAERRMYLPLMALLLLVVLAIDWLTRHLPSLSRGATRPGPGAAATPVTPSGRLESAVWLVIIATLAAGCGLATQRRNREYQSGLTMAQTVLARWPTGYAHLLLGSELSSAGDHQAALGHLREAVLDAPRAQYALGAELLQAGQWDAALDHLQTFVRQEPLMFEVVSARNQIGRILMRRRDFDSAAEQFRLVLQMRPSFSETHGHLADALVGAQRFPEAISEYQQYLIDHPRDTEALRNLGVALEKTGRSTEAIAALRQALLIDPADAAAARDAAIVEFNHENYPGTSPSRGRRFRPTRAMRSHTTSWASVSASNPISTRPSPNCSARSSRRRRMSSSSSIWPRRNSTDVSGPPRQLHRETSG
jgi:tetratricopeptide (TPR) repeat protein